MDITGNSVVKMLKNANLKKGFNGFQIASIPLEICFIVFKIQHANYIRQCIFTHCQYETKVYKTRYIFAIVFYDHAQINYRVNRALLMETCQSKNYTIFFNAIDIDFSVMHENSRKGYPQGWRKW